MAGEYGKGIVGGALTGASSGAMFGPIGAGIGAGIGALAGGLQAGAAKRQRLAAEAADKAVNPIDPVQQAMLNRIGGVERSLRAGTDPASGFAKQSQQNALVQTQANMVRGGIGNVNNLLRSQNAANTGFAQIGAAASQQANSLIPLQANIQNMITERVYERQQQKRADAYAKAAQGEQDLNNLLSGGIGTALQVGMSGIGGGQGGGTKSQQTASTYNRGGLVGNQYVPGVTTGVNYSGFGNGQQQRPNFGFGSAPQQRPNFGFDY